MPKAVANHDIAIGEQKGEAGGVLVGGSVGNLQDGSDRPLQCFEGMALVHSVRMDIINNAGNVLDNILDGRKTPLDPMDFARAFKEDRIKVLDVRDPKEVEPFIEKYKDKWMNIPQNELRDRLDEVPADEPLGLVCGTGARSYECQVLLNQKGFTNIRNVQGGHAMLMATNPDFI